MIAFAGWEGEVMATVEELEAELAKAESAEAFLKHHIHDMRRKNFQEYIHELLAARPITVADIARISTLGDYVYKMFQGRRRLRRDKLLMIALAMQLTAEETNRALRLAKYSPLDVREFRDAVILFGIQHGESLAEVEKTLYDLGADTLTDGKR